MQANHRIVISLDVLEIPANYIIEASPWLFLAFLFRQDLSLKHPGFPDPFYLMNARVTRMRTCAIETLSLHTTPSKAKLSFIRKPNSCHRLLCGWGREREHMLWYKCGGQKLWGDCFILPQLWASEAELRPLGSVVSTLTATKPSYWPIDLIF